MKKQFLIIIYLLLSSKSFAQLQETYTGTFAGMKVLVSIRTNANVLIGALYESKNNGQNFFGTIENNEFSAPIYYKNAFPATCTGEFKNDSLFMKVYLDENKIDKYVTYLLRKSPKSIALDKYFAVGKKTYPPDLVGTWKILNTYNTEIKEFITQPSHKVVMEKNGLLSFIANQIDQTKFAIMNPEWYVIDNEIYHKYTINNRSGDSEFSQKYAIKGDTLVLTSRNNISTYIKVK